MSINSKERKESSWRSTETKGMGSPVIVAVGNLEADKLANTLEHLDLWPSANPLIL